MLIQSREIDYNRDGRVDVFNFTLEFQLTDNQMVSGIRFLAFFDVRLHVCTTTHVFKYCILMFCVQTFSQVWMQSLAYVSSSWSTPCSSVWVGSELHIKQSEPIPRFGVFDSYNVGS